MIENLIKGKGKDFFGKLKINNSIAHQEKDKAGFEKEDWENGYRVLTKRIEDSVIYYAITLFKGPEPKDIITQIRTKNFDKAIKIHYSALDYVKNHGSKTHGMLMP